jgi:indole-3-pyruvate monooxygenase
MNADDIVVIGAGPAGLAVSACLRQHGLEHVVLEREPTVASSWHKHYDRLHLHTLKQLSALPFTPWARETPKYPSRAQMVEYLLQYAAQHQVKPRLGVRVHWVQRAGDRFTLETSAGTLTPRFVVVATGNNAVPVKPDFFGLEGFAGLVVHAKDYKNAQPYAGKRTLVVGSGNSGAEIALDLAEHGVDVAMVVRGPVHVVPRDILGLSSQATGVLLSVLPIAMRDAIVGTVMRVMVGDLSRWGIVRPKIGINQMIVDLGRIPMLDIGTIAKVKQGKIRVLPGVKAVFADRIQFADGGTHPFDAIVLATGYTPGLESMIEGFETMADSRGRPPHLGAESEVLGLFFVGFQNTATGALREIALEARRVADSIKSTITSKV